ncbi:hypothetical protein NHQ30_010005 [Ciborinia camelliae]|nr:hypothetical protein NHQ30_010005 [Ciborinia camelliae]
MQLQKFLAILSSLAVIGLSAPVVIQEDNFDIVGRDEPNSIILARYVYDHQEGVETDVHYTLTITVKDEVEATDKTIERSLSRRSMNENSEFIFPARVMDRNKRGDATIV